MVEPWWSAVEAAVAGRLTGVDFRHEAVSHPSSRRFVSFVFALVPNLLLSNVAGDQPRRRADLGRRERELRHGAHPPHRAGERLRAAVRLPDQLRQRDPAARHQWRFRRRPTRQLQRVPASPTAATLGGRLRGTIFIAIWRRRRIQVCALETLPTARTVISFQSFSLQQ